MSHLLAPNSMVPPSATGAAPGQPGSRLKAMLRLRPFGQPGFSPGRGPGRWFFCGQPAAGPGLSPAVPPVKVVLERGAIRSKTPPQLWGPGARRHALERAAAEVLPLTARADWNLPSHRLPSPCFSQQTTKGWCPVHYNSAKLPPCGPPRSQEGRPPLAALREDRSSGVDRKQMRDKQQAKILPSRPENPQNAVQPSDLPQSEV